MYFPNTSDFEKTVMRREGLRPPSLERVRLDMSRSEIEGPRSRS